MDPNGTTYNYAWFISTDDESEGFYKRGKTQTVNINKALCSDRAQLRFALVDTEFFLLTDHNGNVLTDHNNNSLEAG